MRPREALEVDGLTVTFASDRRPVVRGVSFTIASGEAFGLVGESGSGKSLTCRAILRLLPRGASVTGRITYGSRELLELGNGEMQALRGSSIAMVFQDPLTASIPSCASGTRSRRWSSRTRGSASGPPGGVRSR